MYWDYQKFAENPSPETMVAVIEWHKSTAKYRYAETATAYDRHRNVEILRYRRMVYDLMGHKAEDPTAPNNKICCGFFPQFITQENQYVLGNGVFLPDNVKARLGDRFDTDLQRCGRFALVQGETYGFWSGDRLCPFPIYGENGQPAFVPLLDENTSEPRAGILFWQIDTDEPLNFILYEEDGFTQYRRSNGEFTVVQEKQPYKDIVATSEALGSTVVGGKNYNSLPIKRLRANEYGQSELECVKSLIDSYDRTLSGLANDIDETAFIYWLLNGAEGMSNAELTRFREIVKLTGVAQVGEGQSAQMETKDVPYQARAEQLNRLKDNIYEAFGAVDTKALSGSNMVTAQIRAAYAALDAKADGYEYQLIEFVQDILGLLDIQETPQFKRSGIKNDLEQAQLVMLIRDELDDETTLEMLPGIQPEEIPDILRKREEQSQGRYTAMEPEQPQTEQEQDITE